MSVNSTNPSNLFGGTWTEWGKGKVPVGVDTSDTNFSTVEKTGGEKTHTLTTSELPSHTHTYNKPAANTGSHTLTINEIPSHKHDIFPTYGSVLTSDIANEDKMAAGALGNGWCSKTRGNIGYTGGGKGHTHTISTTSTNTGATGSTKNAHNNLQPYITCYMWKRVS